MRSTPSIERVEIPEGAVGTAKTIARMFSLVDQAKSDWRVRQLASHITQRLNPHDHLAELSALHQWVQKNVRWTRDPRDVELLISPQRILDPEARATTLSSLLAQIRREKPSGDCDDHAVLLCSLAESIGFSTAFKTTATNPLSDGWSHVYGLVLVPDHGWVASDTTGRRFRPLGWEAPGGRNSRTWNRTERMSGMGSLPFELEIDLIKLDEDMEELEPRPPMALMEGSDMSFTGQDLGFVTQEEALDFDEMSGLGQTKAQAAQIASLKRGIKKAKYRPFRKAAFKRRLASLNARIRRQAAAKKKVGTAKAKIAATPAVALGPVPKAVAARLPMLNVQARTDAKVATLKRQKRAAVSALASKAMGLKRAARVARVAGEPAKAREIERQQVAVANQANRLQIAKVRPEYIKRKEIERERIMKAMMGGSGGVAKYGMERFNEGKTTAGGTYKEALRREFLGPYRTQ